MSFTELLHAILLGAVQGVAEFLPISSSGHLVVFGAVLEHGLGLEGSEKEHVVMNVALHVGTLFSIVLVYWQDLRTLLYRPKLCAFIVLATIPAAVVGLTLKSQLEQAFSSPLVVACGWVVTGGLLLYGQNNHRNERTLDAMTARDALLVGLFQSVALVPGISRSGSTISGGLLTGLRRDTAASFSFLIAIPAIAGAAVVQSKDLIVLVLKGESLGAATADSPGWMAMLAGAVTAFLVGVVALRWLRAMISQGKLHWFAYYCLTMAGITVLWQGLAVVFG